MGTKSLTLESHNTIHTVCAIRYGKRMDVECHSKISLVQQFLVHDKLSSKLRPSKMLYMSLHSEIKISSNDVLGMVAPKIEIFNRLSKIKIRVFLFFFRIRNLKMYADNP